LKPDVCRRVVGRLPSPHIQGSLQKPLWFQQRGMAPPFSFAFFGSKPEETKTIVVYLVRSLGLMPESVSHDWHVQPSCQRPNRGPPKRCEFSPGGNARVRNRLSSKLYKHTVRCVSRQSSLPTEFPDDFHSWTVLGGGDRRARSCSETRNSMRLPLGASRHFRRTFCAARYGRQEIEKRSLWRSLL